MKNQHSKLSKVQKLSVMSWALEQIKPAEKDEGQRGENREIVDWAVAQYVANPNSISLVS